MSLKLPPKGKGRKSNIEAYRDAMAIVKLVDHDCEEVEDAAKALGLPLSTAYRLLSRARSMLLTPQIEADKKAAEPKVNQWFEVKPKFSGHPLPNPTACNKDSGDGATDDVGDLEGSPEPQAEVMQHDSGEAKLSGETSSPVGARAEQEVWEWEHLKPYREFMSWPEHRRKQWLAQVQQNEALGGVRWTPVLRGGVKNRTCFRGCPSYQCTCEDNL
jgi:hypothetical protein